MTNIVAITTTIIAINSSEIKTNTQEFFCDPSLISRLYISERSTFFNQPLPEKWVVTTVSKEDKLTFVWSGKTNTIINSETIYSSTNHLRVKQEWESVK